MLIALPMLVLGLLLLALVLFVFILVIRALLKYLRTKEVREEKDQLKRTLGETIRACRTERSMTQEFVAEALGVSRQAVSKWEQGVSHS